MRNFFSRTVDAERRRVTIELDGTVSDEDVREYFQQHPPEETVAATPDYDRLLDLTGLTGDPTLGLVRSIAESLRVARDGFSARYAIVAPTDASYAMMQTLVRLAFEDLQRARVFRSREGAEAWLSLRLAR